MAQAGSGSSASSIFTQSCGTACYAGTLSLTDFMVGTSGYLTSTTTYSPDILPRSSSSTGTIYAMITLTSLQGLDNVSGLTVLLTIILSWTDHQITWVPASYSGVEYMYVSASDIWTPTLTVLNPTSSGTTSITFDELAYINYEGTVQVITTVALATQCDMDLNSFPYDSQTCTVEFSDLQYSTDDLVFYVYSANASTGDYANNSQWERDWTGLSVTTMDMIFNVEGTEYVTFSVLQFQIGVTRYAYYYIANLLIPTILMVLLVIFVFLLPADSGEKVGYSSTLTLSFYVLQQVISALIPSTSTLPNLSTAMLFSFALSAVACFSSIVSVMMRTIGMDLSLETQLNVITGMSRFFNRSSYGVEKFLRSEIEREKEKEQNGGKMTGAVSGNPKTLNTSKVAPAPTGTGTGASPGGADSLLEVNRQIVELKLKARRRHKKEEANDLAWEMIDYAFNLAMLGAFIVVSVVCITLYMI